MMATDRIIEWSATGGAVGVAAVTAAASYENAYALLRARDHGSEGSDKRIKGHFDGHSKGNRRVAARHAERSRPRGQDGWPGV